MVNAATLSTLSPGDRERLARELTPKSNRYIPPTLTTTQNENLKQAAFLLLDQREVFYGGAAAGGKTSGILAAALQYVDVPGYDALLLRRNYKQLKMPGSWIPMAHDWLDATDARWHAGDKQWTFPSGATLTFGFVGQADEDRRKYETAAFQFIGIDELTAWPEEDYRFLFSRLRRRRGVRVPVRMRSGSNPGGRGHEWVKRRFIDPATRIGRAIFLAAQLSDNPYIDADDYIASLQELHPIHWRRLLHGDWDITDPGDMFQPRIWIEPEMYLDEAPEQVQARLRYWDLAATEPSGDNPDPDWTAGVRMSRIANGGPGKPLFVIEHVIRVRRTSGHVEQLIARKANTDPYGTQHWMEQEGGASGKSLVDHYRRNVMPTTVPMRGDRVNMPKAKRARAWSGAMENGRCRIVRGDWNDDLFDELEAFSEDPQHSGAHDDQVDAGSGAFNKLHRPLAAVSGGPAIPRGPMRR